MAYNAGNRNIGMNRQVSRGQFIRTAGIGAAAISAASMGFGGMARATGISTTVYPTDSLAVIQNAINTSDEVLFSHLDRNGNLMQYNLSAASPLSGVLTITLKGVALRALDPLNKPILNITNTTGPRAIVVQLEGASRDVTFEGLKIVSRKGFGVYSCHDCTFLNVEVAPPAGMSPQAQAVYMGEGEIGASTPTRTKAINGTVTVTGCSLVGSNGFDCRMTGRQGSTPPLGHTAFTADFTLSGNYFEATGFYGIALIGPPLLNNPPPFFPGEAPFFNMGNYTITDNTSVGTYGLWCSAVGGNLTCLRNSFVSVRAVTGFGSFGIFLTRNYNSSRPPPAWLFEGNAFSNTLTAYLPNAGSIALGWFGPTGGVTFRNNTMSGKVGVGISMNYPDYPYNLPVNAVTGCVFEGNDMLGLSASDAQVFAQEYASGNVFRSNVFGTLAPPPATPTSGIWCQGSYNQFIDNDFRSSGILGWYTEPYVGCVLLDSMSNDNAVFESGSFPPGTGGASKQCFDAAYPGGNNRVVGLRANAVSDPGIGQIIRNKVEGESYDIAVGEQPADQ